MEKLYDMPNIGKVLVSQLEAVSIFTPEELRETGSHAAWLKIKAIDPSACYNRLLGLEGAIRGMRYHGLPPEVKQELKDFYLKHK